MRKAKELNSIAAENPLFGEKTQGVPTTTRELSPVKSGLNSMLALRNTDSLAGIGRAKKPRERKTTRPR